MSVQYWGQVHLLSLAAVGRFDYLLSESTGISEPMPVAASFAARDEDGFSLSDIARLVTMVTVPSSSGGRFQVSPVS